tara:strand:+ start:1088 stop:1765 length:678 start_codon:yes stop_codon:yes gene_type:complete
LINSQAYSFASLLPGQIGIDAWRIGRLRKYDKSKYKTKLIKATILEKVFALLSQVFILIYFILNDLLIKILFIIIFILIIYLIILLINKISYKLKPIQKYITKISVKDFSKIIFASIICNFISCYLIYAIANSLNMEYSFNVLSLSSTLSNMSSVIPITPNGLGLSEFIFSEITENISDIENVKAVSTIYFTYRILNLTSHFGIYYIIKILGRIIKNNGFLQENN